MNNKVTAISSVQGLFTDIEDKPRRLRILKALLTALDYGDALNTEIDAEIAALEEAAAKAAAEGENAEGAEGGTETASADAGAGDTSADSGGGNDIDLGSLEALEGFNTGSGDILLEDHDVSQLNELELLTEEDLPSPSELDSDKDFSENH